MARIILLLLLLVGTLSSPAAPVDAEALGTLAQRIVGEGLSMDRAVAEFVALGGERMQGARFWALFSDLASRGVLRRDATHWAAIAKIALTERLTDSQLVNAITEAAYENGEQARSMRAVLSGALPVACGPIWRKHFSLTVEFPPSDRDLLETLVAKLRAEVKNDVSYDFSYKDGSWQLMALSFSAEEIFLVNDLLRDEGASSRNISYSIDTSRITNAHVFYQTGPDVRHAFLAQLAVREADVRSFLDSFAAHPPGLKLTHVSGNVVSGEGTRAQILSLAENIRVGSIDLVARAQGKD